MKPLYAATLGLALLAASGCATRPAAPDWVHGVSHDFPASQYLTGRGHAATEEAARAVARAELAGVFDLAAAVEDGNEQVFGQDQDGAPRGVKSAGANGTRAPRRAAPGDQRTADIRTAGVWQDPRTGTYYALAVLPRRPTARRLRQEIARLDAATRQYLAASRRATDVFLKIGGVERALDAQRERAGYAKALRIVEPASRGAASAWNTARLGADLNTLLGRVYIAARVAPGAPDGFAAAVRDALAAAGFTTATDTRPDYVLDARLQERDLGLQEYAYGERGTLQVTLRNAGDDRVRGSRRWDIEVSAPDPATARQRAFDRAASILNWELRDTLVGFAPR